MNQKNKKILIILYISIFLVTCIGAAFAYFANIATSYVTKNAQVESATMTSIFYKAGNPIAIVASPDNFAEGMESLRDTTTATASLKKGSSVEYEYAYYNLHLVIEENTMVYTTSEKKAEILVKITDPKGNEIKKINGLNYVESDGNSGFDITGKVGEFTIVTNYEMYTNTDEEIIQNWNLEVVFVNFDSEQNINQGNYLNGALEIGPVVQ